MHPCLLVTDILNIIFQLVDMDSGTGSPDILSLVKTCRAFHEPGLDVLWRNIPNIVPLLLAMPTDLWHITTDRRFEFKREVTPEDWEVFDRYAYRVRILGLLLRTSYMPKSDRQNFIFLSTVHPFIYEKLAIYRTPILPNLTVIMGNADLSYLLPFLTPKLAKINVPVQQKNVEDFARLVKELPFRSPNIQGLDFNSVGWWGKPSLRDKAAELLSQMICQLSHIEELDSGTLTISTDALRHLSSMLSVRKLSIYTDFGEYTPLAPHRGDSLPLRHFSLKAERFNPEAYAKFIDTLAPYTLQRAVIYLTVHLSRDDLQLLIDSLTKRYNRENNISMIMLHKGLQHPTDEIITFSVFKPLLSFSNFTMLSLRANLVDLSNSELLQLVKAMPKLDTLLLGCQCQNVDKRAKLTLDGLLHVASFCPQIEHLSLFIHGIFDEIVPQEDMDRAVNRELGFLEVGDSTLDLPEEEVAAFLHALFPKIKDVSHGRRHLSDAAHVGWEKVATIIYKE